MSDWGWDIFESFLTITISLTRTLLGKIPDWLSVTLLKNGPGKFKFGDTEYNHLFDGMAFLQRYHFKDSKVAWIKVLLFCFWSSYYLKTYRCSTPRSISRATPTNATPLPTESWWENLELAVFPTHAKTSSAGTELILSAIQFCIEKKVSNALY